MHEFILIITLVIGILCGIAGTIAVQNIIKTMK